MAPVLFDQLGFIGEEVTETSGTRAWGESIPPTPPRKAPAIWRDVISGGFSRILGRAIWALLTKP